MSLVETNHACKFVIGIENFIRNEKGLEPVICGGGMVTTW